ncbi:YesK-like family protein [Solibacillus sp. MA9]|uniref:YesK-like family protein n=1 Tax=Solibacillus palustris TaxID=2908203 RepID=A0ABS9UI46_9BACL|nr:YesK-like family protein [Solibacillus sp. MA9]MCH7324018.1 YesK-like family protein [Solibacillus sp. MA9]
MDGFEFFIYISLAVTILFVIASMFLKRNKYDKYIILVFVGLLLISIGIIVTSLFVGGWTGMGYGFIGLSILIGTIIGGLIFSVIKYFRKT